MKAVRVNQWGGSEAAVIEEVERPQPAPGEVLIRVKAAAINPVDWKIREGYLQDWVTLPYPLGSDFAGDVEAVGEGVVGLEPGTPVYGMKGLRGGAFADYTTALLSEFARKPASLSYEEAAAVPHAAVTAWQALYEGDSVTGKRILVHAAAGGVGHFATQLAKLRGAYVIGTGSAHNESFVKELGADEFVDYPAAPFETMVNDVDIVLDTVGFDTSVRSCEVIKPGGTLICFVTPPPAEQVAQHGIHAKYAAGQATSEVLTEIAHLIDQGRLKPHIHQVLSFDDVHEALRLSQTQHVRGKVVVTMDA